MTKYGMRVWDEDGNLSFDSTEHAVSLIRSIDVAAYPPSAWDGIQGNPYELHSVPEMYGKNILPLICGPTPINTTGGASIFRLWWWTPSYPYLKIEIIQNSTPFSLYFFVEA